MEIEVLRIGQRVVRDDRVTTHAALVARAFGASRIYMDEVNPEIRETVAGVNATWGGGFEVVMTDGWRGVIREKIRGGFAVVHLTMYGEPVNEVGVRIAEEGRILAVVGAGKVPREVYDLARYNVAVASQPHSEIGALAVLLDRVQGGRQFGREFGSPERVIFPSARGKDVRAGPAAGERRVNTGGAGGNTVG